MRLSPKRMMCGVLAASMALAWMPMGRGTAHWAIVAEATPEEVPDQPVPTLSMTATPELAMTPEMTATPAVAGVVTSSLTVTPVTEGPAAEPLVELLTPMPVPASAAETSEMEKPEDTEGKVIGSMPLTMMGALTASLAMTPGMWLARSLAPNANSADLPLQGWTPSVNQAQVDLFSGALSWAYDFNLPPGPGGVRPSLSLNYNSRRMDGLWSWGQSDWVGYGWSLDMPEIMRPGVYVKACDIGCSTPNEYYIHRDGDYQIVLSGQSSKLVDVGGGMWRAEDDHFSRIVKKADDSWEVTARDGTRYLLGATADSKVIVDGPIGTSFTTARSIETMRYRVSQSIFTNGVSVTYAYVTHSMEQQCGIWTAANALAHTPCQYGILRSGSTRASYLREISYTGARVVFNRSARWAENELYRIGNDGARWNAYWAWNHVDARWPVYYQTDVLRSIDLYQQRPVDGQWEKTRGWRFTYGRYVAQDCVAIPRQYGCPGSDTDVLEGIKSINMRVLARFQEIAVADGFETALPGYSFGYFGKANRDRGNSNDPYDDLKYDHPRLGSINNGATGLIQVDMDTPDGGTNMVKYYRINTRDVLHAASGAGGAVLNRETYAYSGERCFSRLPTDRGCSGRGDASKGEEVFHGYRETTVTTRDGNQSPLKQERTRFSFGEEGWQALGRPVVLETQSAVGAPMLRATRTWQAIPTLGAARFVGLRQEEATDLSSGQTTRTEYRYDGYGNVLAVLDYGFTHVAGDERSTVREYRPNAGAGAGTIWMVDRVAREALLAGITEDINGATKQSEARYLYDGAGAWNAPPASRGLLTRVDRGTDTTGWVTTRTAYDGWANPTVITDANGNRTAMGYDASGRFKLSETNALGHVTRYEYVGVNGAAQASGAGHFGALKRVIDANGAQTQATYDAFGRVSSLIRPLDTPAAPSTRYEYDNTDWPVTFVDSFESGPNGWEWNGMGRIWMGRMWIGRRTRGTPGRPFVSPTAQAPAVGRDPMPAEA